MVYQAVQVSQGDNLIVYKLLIMYAKCAGFYYFKKVIRKVY